MQTGYYKLTADVQNPKPDKRSKRRIDAQPVWKAGTVVWLTNDAPKTFERLQKDAGERLPPEAMPDDFGAIRFSDNSVVLFDTADKEHKFKEEVQGNPMIPLLVPAEKTLGQIIKQADWTPEGLLGLLIDTGKITIGDVDAIKHHDLTPDVANEDWQTRDAANDAFYKRHELQ